MKTQGVFSLIIQTGAKNLRCRSRGTLQFIGELQDIKKDYEICGPELFAREMEGGKKIDYRWKTKTI